MTAIEQKNAAKEFALFWKDKGYEKGESQKFWISLLTNVFGVENIDQFIIFEEQVKLDHTSFIDVMIPSTHVMIEQKSINKNLRAGIKQSDGSFLTPFQQAKRYSAELPYSQRPRFIVTCNFKEFLVYDMENPNSEPESILLENLPKEYNRLSFLVQKDNIHLKREMEVSLQAGEIVGVIYDALLKQYVNPNCKHSLKSLNVLCVRIVFCLYAEDAGIFGRKSMFHDYLASYNIKHFREALINLFKILDTKIEDRDPYLDDDLAEFPYVNGGLFADEDIEIPRFTEEIKAIILSKASNNFDWSEISPTIFGAVFESTLNPETRRSGGMHYTSIENIHKVIDPLFYKELKDQYEKILEYKQPNVRKTKLEDFQKKMATLIFLDPACGSGNFLTETYLSLRRLENNVLKEILDNKIGFHMTGDAKFIHVSISQFYGIEINDFAVTVAKTALWIAESQMMKETEEILQTSLEFLPLKSYANIIEGNALRIDWESVVPKDKLSYIMGNPPFVGARLMDAEQKKELQTVFENTPKNGNLDYVSCWFKKSANLMEDTNIRTALVSTNSITQGEQVSILWKDLFEQGVHIDFAYRTFRWDSEASLKAHVHCVIVGFSKAVNTNPKYIFNNGTEKVVKNINGYLIEAENIFIENINNSICINTPKMRSGNKPIDDGNYLFTEEEMLNFIKKEPKSKKYFRKWIGAKEFINGYYRYCLWLGDCSPKELRSMPECLKRVENVRQFRLSSASAGTRKIADNPTNFHVKTLLNEPYLIMPLTSSEKRRYVPIGFVSPNVMASNLVNVVSNAQLYHFGILTSNVFMAWMRAICGRLKSDYRITKDNVYNTFPWCNEADEQKAKIEKTAQGILDARAKYPDCSLADLYDELTMPPELRKAHQQNDIAVMNAYGFDKNMSEGECVARLFEMYKTLTERG